MTTDTGELEVHAMHGPVLEEKLRRIEAETQTLRVMRDKLRLCKEIT
jgi:hypothetical protein